MVGCESEKEVETKQTNRMEGSGVDIGLQVIEGSVEGVIFVFFFNDTATTEIYTLSLHDALPIWVDKAGLFLSGDFWPLGLFCCVLDKDRGNTISLVRSEEHTSELQSPVPISYAVFCLKKKTILSL